MSFSRRKIQRRLHWARRLKSRTLFKHSNSNFLKRKSSRDDSARDIIRRLERSGDAVTQQLLDTSEKLVHICELYPSLQEFIVKPPGDRDTKRRLSMLQSHIKSKYQ